MTNWIISGVASGILIESVLICATWNPRLRTSFFKSIMNKAPRLATILSIFLGSLNGLANEADVSPYTELMAVFNAFAKSFDVISPSITLWIYGVSFPSSIVFTISHASCLMLTRPSTISRNALVNLGPNSTSAITLCGCIDETSKSATFPYIPGTPCANPPSPTSSPL